MTTGASSALERLRAGVATALARRGCDWASFAAAIAVARGARRLDRTAFAALLGVDAWSVFALEHGLVHPALAPLAITLVAPEFDWAAMGVPVPPDAGAPARHRHPSARAPARIRVRARDPPSLTWRPPGRGTTMKPWGMTCATRTG